MITDAQIRQLETTGKHRSGDGLYLEIHARRSGGVTKSWTVRYAVGAGKYRWKGLGRYPEVSLARAKAMAAEIRESARSGRDPLAERDARRAEAAQATASRMTFRKAAEGYLAAHESQWRNDKHRSQWRNTLETYAFPVIGETPVADIDSAAITAILDPIWLRVPETASRIRGRLENILDWAAVRGLRQGENPARWKGKLAMAYPSKNKVRTVRHHCAASVEEAPTLWGALSSRKGAGTDALRFLILTAARSGEVRLARWSEIDSKKGIWTIPAERMKAKRPHRVPLTQEALSILQHRSTMFGGAPDGLVFASDQIAGAALSDMTLKAVLRRIGRGELTVHGFRSTFRDWCGDRTHYPRELAEEALAHVVGSATERAYRRSDGLEKRRPIMADWAAFLTGTTSEE